MQHLHRNEGWVEGRIADCEACRPFVEKAPALLSSDYKASTRTIKRDSRGSTETLHWSGRQDVNIRPAPATMTRKGRGVQ